MFPGVGHRLDGTVVATTSTPVVPPPPEVQRDHQVDVAEVLLQHEEPMRLLSEVKKLHTCTASWLYNGMLDSNTSQQVDTLLLELTIVISKMEIVADILPYHTECEMLSHKWQRLYTTIAATAHSEPSTADTILDVTTSSDEEQ